jgi:hypothetical protein
MRPQVALTAVSGIEVRVSELCVIAYSLKSSESFSERSAECFGELNTSQHCDNSLKLLFLIVTVSSQLPYECQEAWDRNVFSLERSCFRSTIDALCQETSKRFSSPAEASVFKIASFDRNSIAASGPRRAPPPALRAVNPNAFRCYVIVPTLHCSVIFQLKNTIQLTW